MNRPFHSGYLSALCGVMITLFVLELVTIINNGHNYYEAFAVRNTSSLTTTEPPLASISRGEDTSFSAVGMINSLIITVPNTGFNISSAFKVIISGDWTLNVHDGNVTYFSANLLASPMDAIQPHTHQITNFKPEKPQNARTQLTPDTSLTVNGTVDVKVNGLTMWKNVHSSISISKANIMSISLDDKETSGHFGKQPIFGLVTRLMVY
jgi:hypothetical protein